jgi:UDP-glucuronate 4-epimerase
MMRNGSAIPVHVDAPSIYHPLHEDDILAILPALVGVATVPATVVNWGGDEAVSIEEWCTYLSELTGVAVTFEPTADTTDGVDINLSKMHQLVGTTSVPWREGMRKMVASRHPELLPD